MFSPHSAIRSLELRALEGTGNAAPLSHLSGEETHNQIEFYGQAKDRIVSRFTHDYVTDLLAQTGGNVTRAAELSGLGRASLQKIMRRLGIKSDGFRKEE
jgi:DNA-binding NtrC family response regulator